MRTRIVSVVVLALIVGSIGLVQQAVADFGTKTVWMSVTNTKTGTVKAMEWEAQKYHFEKDIVIEVDKVKETKINQIFGTTEFRFTWKLDEYETTWHHFIVAIGTRSSSGTYLQVLFTQPGDNGRTVNVETSRSSDLVKLNSIRTFISSDKSVYLEGETATVFIGFVDANDRLVDPDRIRAHFNLTPIEDTLERKKPGSYVYVTPPLESGHNRIIIVSEKAGHNVEIGATSFNVLPEGSVGTFQFPS